MEAAVRGLKRLDGALTVTGPEALGPALDSVAGPSVDKITSLKTLHALVSALETKAGDMADPAPEPAEGTPQAGSDIKQKHSSLTRPPVGKRVHLRRFSPGCASAIANLFGWWVGCRHTSTEKLAWLDIAGAYWNQTVHSLGTTTAAARAKKLRRSAQLSNGHSSRGGNRQEQGCEYYLSNHELTPFSDKKAG